MFAYILLIQRFFSFLTFLFPFNQYLTFVNIFVSFPYRNNSILKLYYQRTCIIVDIPSLYLGNNFQGEDFTGKYFLGSAAITAEAMITFFLDFWDEGITAETIFVVKPSLGIRFSKQSLHCWNQGWTNVFFYFWANYRRLWQVP